MDESGNSNLKPVQKALNKGQVVKDQEIHFTIGAVKIPVCNFEKLRDKVMGVKHKYWKDGLYTYPNGVQKRVCFHTKEINSQKGPFSTSCINFGEFVSDVNILIDDGGFTFFATHINKQQLCQRYYSPLEPYDLGLTFILERILLSIDPTETIILVLESRGEKEDKNLLNHIKELIGRGTKYVDSSRFQSIKGVYFNPKWPKSSDEKKSYWALEIADLCVSPTNNHFKNPTKVGRDFEHINKKFNDYPNFWGRGLKTFP